MFLFPLPTFVNLGQETLQRPVTLLPRRFIKTNTSGEDALWATWFGSRTVKVCGRDSVHTRVTVYCIGRTYCIERTLVMCLPYCILCHWYPVRIYIYCIGRISVVLWHVVLVVCIAYLTVSRLCCVGRIY